MNELNKQILLRKTQVEQTYEHLPNTFKEDSEIKRKYLSMQDKTF